MSSHRSHQDIKDALGAYAVAAVDEGERRAIEAHLQGCAECQAEVAAHLEALAGLADPDAPPPPGIWGRIEAGIRAQETPTPIPVPRRAPRMRLLAAALSATLAAVVGVLGWRVVDLDRRLDRVGEGVRGAALTALADPAARRVVLRSPDAALAVDAVVLPDGQGYLLQGNLEPLAPAQTYQLWAFVGQEPISVGVLGPDPGVAAFRIAPQTAMLAITAERAGGVPAPRHPPLVTAPLSTT